MVTKPDENATTLPLSDREIVTIAMKAAQGDATHPRDMRPFNNLTPAQLKLWQTMMVEQAKGDALPGTAPTPSTLTPGNPYATGATANPTGINYGQQTGVTGGPPLQAMDYQEPSGITGNFRPSANAQTYANIANGAAAAGASIFTGAPPGYVIREHPGKGGDRLDPATRIGAGLPTRGKPGTFATTTEYEGEFGEKYIDPKFRGWMDKRAVVVGGANPTNGAQILDQADNLWKYAGAKVSSNPSLKNKMTPEEWLDMQYKLLGGDAAYEAKLAEANKEAEGPPPIVKSTQTQTYTVNAAQAQAAIDNMSQALLGRMASAAELKKARGAMQGLLTPTVTSSVTDRTDEANITTSQHTKLGVSPDDAAQILRMRMQRGSEGMAANLGQMFEEALAGM